MAHSGRARAIQAKEPKMNTSVGRARIGQWYVREGKGEIFLVTGYDERARTIEIQTFDGDLDEIDLRTWSPTPEYPLPPCQ